MAALDNHGLFTCRIQRLENNGEFSSQQETDHGLRLKTALARAGKEWGFADRLRFRRAMGACTGLTILNILFGPDYS